MGLKDLYYDYIMVDVLPDALVLHHFSCKAIIENLGLVKEGALHQVILNKLIGIGQEVLWALFVDDGLGDDMLKNLGVAQ